MFSSSTAHKYVTVSDFSYNDIHSLEVLGESVLIVDMQLWLGSHRQQPPITPPPSPGFSKNLSYSLNIKLWNRRPNMYQMFIL